VNWWSYVILILAVRFFETHRSSVCQIFYNGILLGSGARTTMSSYNSAGRATADAFTTATRYFYTQLCLPSFWPIYAKIGLSEITSRNAHTKYTIRDEISFSSKTTASKASTYAAAVDRIFALNVKVIYSSNNCSVFRLNVFDCRSQCWEKRKMAADGVWTLTNTLW